MLPARPGRCRVQLHRMVPAPAPPHISTIYTDGDGQLWHRYTAVCCGAHTRSVHMHMFNYTICTHCEKCSEECEIDGLCRRFQLCREAVLPPADREKQVPRCSSVIMDTATPTFTTFTTFSLDTALVVPGSSNQVLVLDINWTMIVVQVSSCL